VVFPSPAAYSRLKLMFHEVVDLDAAARVVPLKDHDSISFPLRPLHVSSKLFSRPRDVFFSRK
jgi:hypothetical protein